MSCGHDSTAFRVCNVCYMQVSQQLDSALAQNKTLALAAKHNEELAAHWKKESDFQEGLYRDARAARDKHFKEKQDATLQVDALKKALVAECRHEACDWAECYGGYQKCSGCEARAKAAYGPGWGDAEKKKEEAPAYTFTPSTPTKGDRYADGWFTHEYDGVKWNRVGPSITCNCGVGPDKHLPGCLLG